MGGNQSSGSASLAAGEAKNWQTRYAGYANRDGGMLVLADGKPLILKASIELTLACESGAGAGTVQLRVRETTKDKAHASLILSTPDTPKASDAKSSALALSESNAISRSVRWRNYAFAVMSPPFMIDQIACVRVWVSKDAGSVAGVNRVHLLRPFNLAFSRPYAALKVRAPHTNASAAASPVAAGAAPAAASLLLTRKSDTSIYTTYPFRADAKSDAATAAAAISVVPACPTAALDSVIQSHVPTAATTATAAAASDESTEPEEISLANHQIGRWGPYIIRRLPPANANASASESDPFASTVMPLAVDMPSQNSDRVLTHRILLHAFQAIAAASNSALIPPPFCASNIFTAQPAAAAGAASDATATAAGDSSRGDMIRALIVSYAVTYPLFAPLRYDEPCVVFFDQTAIGRPYAGIESVPTVSVEVLNAGSRRAGSTADGVIRLRIGSLPAAVATAAFAFGESESKSNSQSDSGAVAVLSRSHDSFAVAPSVSLTSDAMMNWRDVSTNASASAGAGAGAGLALQIAVSLPFYQSVQSAQPNEPVSDGNSAYPYPYIKVLIRNTNPEHKRFIAAAASGDADAVQAAIAAEASAKAAAAAAAAQSAAAVERPAYDEDDEMSAFRKKKVVDKKSAREIDLGFIKSFQSTEF